MCGHKGRHESKGQQVFQVIGRLTQMTSRQRFNTSQICVPEYSALTACRFGDSFFSPWTGRGVSGSGGGRGLRCCLRCNVRSHRRLS